MSLTITEAKDAAKLLFEMEDKSFVPALVGLAGIGKTWAVNQLAEETGKTLIKFNASQLQEGDLAMPFKNSKDEVIYAIHKKLKLALDNPDKEYLIFFDEANRPRDIGVINELMTIINEGEVYGEKFSDKVRFIMAMNPTQKMEGFEDTEYAVSEMDDAHYNRFVLINIEISVSAWLEWGKDKIHSSMQLFFKEFDNTRYFHSGQKSSKVKQIGVQVASPRSWFNISTQMKEMDAKKLSINTNIFREIVAGQVGRDKASIFLDWIAKNIKSIKPEEILTGEKLEESLLIRFKSVEGPQQKSTYMGAAKKFLKGPKKIDGDPVLLQNAENMFELLMTIKQEDLRLAIVKDLLKNPLFDMFDFEISEEYREQFSTYVAKISTVMNG